MRRRPLTMALLGAALVTTLIAGRAPADESPPVTGDILVSVQTPIPGIIRVNALGGQTRLCSFLDTGAHATSIVYPGDGFIYAARDRVVDDTFDSIARIDPTTGDIVTLVDQTTSEGQMASPTGIDIDAATGDIIFCQGGQVLRADPTDGSVEVVSQFNLLGDLQEVVLDPTGTYAYVVDDATDGVVRVTLSDGAQVRLVTAKASVFDTIISPYDLVLDGTGIVAVSMPAGLTRFDLAKDDGEDVLRAPATGDVDPGAAFGVDIDQAGSFVTCDFTGNTIYRVAPDGSGMIVTAGGEIGAPNDLVVVGGLGQSTGGPIGGGGGGGGGGGDCLLCDLGGSLSGKMKSKVKKVGKDKSDVLSDLSFGPDGTTWTLSLGGKQLSGTATAANKKGTKAVLTPDQASVDALLALLGERLNAPDPQPFLVLSKDPKLTFKTNKKGSRGKLSINVKVETDIGAKTYKGSLKAKLKGATSDS